MYEWTTETGKHDSTEQTFAVLRGGNFYSYSSATDPACIRNGGHATAETDLHFGFRVVLYVK